MWRQVSQWFGLTYSKHYIACLIDWLILPIFDLHCLSLEGKQSQYLHPAVFSMCQCYSCCLSVSQIIHLFCGRKKPFFRRKNFWGILSPFFSSSVSRLISGNGQFPRCLGCCRKDPCLFSLLSLQVALAACLPLSYGEKKESVLWVTPCLKKLALSSESNILSVCFISVFWSYCNDRNGIDRVVLNALEYTVSSLQASVSAVLFTLWWCTAPQSMVFIEDSCQTAGGYCFFINTLSLDCWLIWSSYGFEEDNK